MLPGAPTPLPSGHKVAATAAAVGALAAMGPVARIASSGLVGGAAGTRDVWGYQGDGWIPALALGTAAFSLLLQEDRQRSAGRALTLSVVSLLFCVVALVAGGTLVEASFFSASTRPLWAIPLVTVASLVAGVAALLGSRQAALARQAA